MEPNNQNQQIDQLPPPTPPETPPIQQTLPPPIEPAKTDPGLALAIIGLILTFAIAPIGFIINLIALKKSQPSTTARTIALTGTAISSFFMIILLFFLWNFARSYETLNDNQQKTSVALESLQSAQNTIWPHIRSLNGSYILPATLEKIKPMSDVQFGTLKEKPKTPRVIEYAVCNEGSIGRLGYWHYSLNHVSYKYIQADQDLQPRNCKVITN